MEEEKAKLDAFCEQSLKEVNHRNGRLLSSAEWDGLAFCQKRTNTKGYISFLLDYLSNWKIGDPSHFLEEKTYSCVFG